MRHSAYRLVLGRFAAMMALAATGACGTDLIPAQPTEVVAPHAAQAGAGAVGSATYQSLEPRCEFERPEYFGFVYVEPTDTVPPVIVTPVLRQVVDMYQVETTIQVDVRDEILWTCTPEDPSVTPFLVPPEYGLFDPEFALHFLPTDLSTFGAWFLTYPIPSAYDPDFGTRRTEIWLWSTNTPILLGRAPVEVQLLQSPPW